MGSFFSFAGKSKPDVTKFWVLKMAANLTIYCLENITDYLGFERLCHDLMALEGYSSIEPLGGFSDKGRDAIHVSASNETTIFAYSVREDWRAKLAEDAEKIYKHGHACCQLVFVTTANVTAHQRDEAVKSIRDEFAWYLDLFDVERLRVLLEVNHPHIREQHPGIFPREFLEVQSRNNTSTERNHLFIPSASEDDGVFAEWLARKLTAEGYLVWCEQVKLLGGATYPDDVDTAIRDRTFRFLGLYSQASLKDLEVMRQKSLALHLGSERQQDFLIPLDVDGVNRAQLDQVTSALKFISFKDNWAAGLKQLLEKLESVGCPRLLPTGKRVAAEAFLERNILSKEKETLFSNCFRVLQIPQVIYRFKALKAIPEAKLDALKSDWSYRKVDSRTFLSFHKPPASIAKEYGISEKGGGLWPEVEKIDGIWSTNLVSELIRKALVVKCHQKGLKDCPEAKLLYFPPDLVKNNWLNFTRPNDGLKTHVRACGSRTFRSGQSRREYRYSLAPVFSVRQALLDNFTVLLRIRVHLSDTKGKAFTDKRTIVSRRKHLCKNWWNNHWLSRVLAVSQFLADDGKITIGEPHDAQIIIDAVPLHLSAPVGINEDALGIPSLERPESLRNYDEHSDADINDEEDEDD